MIETTVHIGILSFQILIAGSQSLKEKRRVLKSIKDRIRAQFNVSIAEIDSMDKWQIAALGVCMIGNDKPYLDGTLQKIAQCLVAMGGFELLRYEMDFL